MLARALIFKWRWQWHRAQCWVTAQFMCMPRRKG